MTKPASVCPAANLCELTQLQGPICGSIPEHLSKIALPGTLCTRAIWQQYEGVVSQTALQTSPGAFALQQAGLLIELGIASAHNPTEADNFFANAKHWADLETNNMQSRASTYTAARLMNLFQPAYKAWGPHYWATGPAKKELQMGISTLMTDVRELPIHSNELPEEHFLADDHAPCFNSENSQRKAYLDLAFLQLCLKARLGVIPSTPRSGSMCNAFVAIDNKITAVRLIHRRFTDELPPALAAIRFDNLAHRSNRPEGKPPILRGDRDGVADQIASYLERESKRILDDKDKVKPPSDIQKVTDTMSLNLSGSLRHHVIKNGLKS